MTVGVRRTFLIFDIGTNYWDGKSPSLSLARKLVKAVADSGADAVKFQTFSAKTHANPKYAPELYKELKKLEMPLHFLPKLKKYARSLGIVFFSTPFSVEDIDTLEKIKVPLYKVASAQITDTNFLRYMASKNKPILMSCGGADTFEIERAILSIRMVNPLLKLTLLHCTAKYDLNLKPSECNLAAMLHLKELFKLPVGLSDHSPPNSISPLLAVAMGAEVVEKHITISRNPKFYKNSDVPPDTPFAMEPQEAKRLVERIRKVEEMLGPQKKTCLECEIPYISKARKSIYARVDIPNGGVIKKSALAILRPPKGLEPRHFDEVVGRRARKNIEKGEPIKWDLLEER